MRLISKIGVTVAVAGACGYLSASTITSGPVIGFGLESALASTATTDVFVGSVNIVLGDNYQVGDRLNVSILGATFSSANSQPSGFDCGTGATSLTASLSTSSTGSTLIYNVRASSGTTDGAAYSCAVGSLFVEAGSLAAAGSVTLDVDRTSTTGVSGLDATTAVTAATISNAYSVTASSAFDAVIDVQASRLQFASNDNDGSVSLAGEHDTFAFSINVDTTKTAVSAISGTMVLTLTASNNFNFLVDPLTDTAGTCSVGGNGVAQATASVGGNAVAGTVAQPATACNQLTITVATVGAGQYTVGLGRSIATSAATLANSSVFGENTYTASVVATLSGSGGATRAQTLSGTPTAGAWTINGTTVTIPYLPLGASTDLIVNIANVSNQAGEVTFTAYNAGGVACTGSLGNITANQNLSVGSTLKARLRDATVCTGAGWADATRATVILSVPTPATTTSVNSSFSLSDGKSRGVVVNSTNGRP